MPGATLGLGPAHWLAAVAACAGMALVVGALPLAVYGLALALFGLPHVLAELRFIDLRYSIRVGSLLRPLLLLLAGACAMRLAGSYGWLPREIAIPGELLLMAATVLLLQRRLGVRRWAAWMVGVAFAAAAAVVPFHTLLVLAAAHNLTPIGFIGHVLVERRERLAAPAVAALLIFGVIPAAIASGLVGALMAWTGLSFDPDTMLIPSGALGKHLGTAVPREITDPTLTFNLFAAAVYLQCVHYAAVIHVMPRLLQQPARPLLAWPRHAAMRLALIAVGLATGLAFALDFSEARRVYATIAAFHAWTEVPILLLVLSGCLGARRASR